jgi:putative addiction module antidote
MSHLKIRRVGNSLGVIFPKEIQEALNITEGDIIDVTTLGGNMVVLGSHLPHHSQWTFKNTKLSDEDQRWLDADLEDNNDKTPRW